MLLKSLGFFVFLVGQILVGQEVKISNPKQENKKTGVKFWAVATALQLSTVYDVETTLGVWGRCSECEDANILARPFVKNRVSLYVYTAGINAGSLYAVHKIKNSKNKRLRKIWWVMPVAVTGIHMFAGFHNRRLR